jgi:hypothetical protein
MTKKLPRNLLLAYVKLLANIKKTIEMRNWIITLLCLMGCINCTVKTELNQKNIVVTEFDDFNGKRVDSLKGFFSYSGEYLEGDSVKSYGLTLLLDTVNDSVLYAFMEESPATTKENPKPDWKIVSGLKIEHLNSFQINATCNNFCHNPNDDISKYFAIIKDYKNDGKVELFKTYKLDFENKKIVENIKDSVICEIIQGQD